VGSNGLIQSAAIDIPRFDHDPVTGVCRGLLIEESRTNLCQQSEAFNDSFWVKTRLSVTLNATTAPDGTLTADKIVEDTTASNTHTIQSPITPPATAHTLSVFAKKGERTWIVLRLGGTNTFFNLDDGTIAAGSVNSPTITNFGNGWYRCAVTSSLGTQGQFWLATNSTTTSYTGDGTSGLFIWGAQLEAGSFATSYIPTTTGSLARSADVCSIANTASFWNSDQFTLLGNANFPNPAHDAYAANFSITNGFFGVRRPNTNTATAIIRSLGVNADISLGTFVTGTMRMAAAHSSGQQAAAFNGGSATQASSAFSPSLNPALNIGYSGTAGYINGHIAAIRYYKKRLPNAKLQALTA
jgi:hypothetical protein